MSKIGKMPITIPSGVTVTIQGDRVQITGPKGTVPYIIPQNISAEVNDGKVVVSSDSRDDRIVSARYGLTRANLANIIKGVDSGFEKKLELTGVGYRAQMQGNKLVLSLGFSHPVNFTPDEGVNLMVADNVITISGIDKTMVGQAAAKIRAVRPPEPYKGKGIKYQGEKIRRKAGKAAKAAGAK